MIVARVIYLACHALLGAALGHRSPVAGLAVLVALVATTASLPWHVGLGRPPAVEAYVVALLAAAGLGVLRRRRVPDDPERPGTLPALLRASVLLFGLTVVVATVLAVLRVEVPWRPEPGPGLGASLRGLLDSRPTGVAAQLHAAWVALSGPALLLLGVSFLRRERSQRLIRNASFAGVGMAVAGPPLLALVSNPWLRADLGRVDIGISGLFGDQHSYAAYLVLGIGVSLGAALGRLEAGRWWRGGAGVLLALAVATAVVFSNSRGGVVAAMATVLLLLAAVAATTSLAVRDGGFPSGLRAGAVVVVGSVVLAAGLLVASPTLRQAAQARLGDPHLLAPLAGDWNSRDLRSYQGRLALWRKGGILAAERPLWGIGPAGFGAADVPLATSDGIRLDESVATAHAHNYFLQLAAEYGLPAMLAFVLMATLALGIVVRGARRAEDPQERWLLGGIAAGQAGFLGLSLIHHPLLLAEMQAAYWTLAALGVAMSVRAAGPPSGRASGGTARRWITVAVCVYVGLAAVELGRNRLVAVPHDRADVGFSPWRRVPVRPGSVQPVLLRWSDPSSILHRPVGGPVLSLLVVRDRSATTAGQADETGADAPAPATSVDFTLDGEPLGAHALPTDGLYWFRYYLPTVLGEDRWAEVEAAGIGGSRASEAGGHEAGDGEVSRGEVGGIQVGDSPVEGSEVGGGEVGGNDEAGTAAQRPAVLGAGTRGTGMRRPGGWKELRPWSRAPAPPWIRLETEVETGPDPATLATGVGIASLEWLAEVPPQGIGFQAGGTDAGGRAFRWTGRRASLPLRPQRGRVVVRLRALHPDIDRVPVTVDVYWNAGLRRTVVLSDRAWVDAPVSVDTGGGRPGVLTLVVDRTWSPARAGVSADTRELGVAVTGVDWR